LIGKKSVKTVRVKYKTTALEGNNTKPV